MQLVVNSDSLSLKCIARKQTAAGYIKLCHLHIHGGESTDRVKYHCGVALESGIDLTRCNLKVTLECNNVICKTRVTVGLFLLCGCVTFQIIKPERCVNLKTA